MGLFSQHQFTQTLANLNLEDLYAPRVFSQKDKFTVASLLSNFLPNTLEMVCVLETSLASSVFRAYERGSMDISRMQVGLEKEGPTRVRGSLGEPGEGRGRSEGCGGAWARLAKRPGGGAQGGAAPPAWGERRAAAPRQQSAERDSRTGMQKAAMGVQ